MKRFLASSTLAAGLLAALFISAPAAGASLHAGADSMNRQAPASVQAGEFQNRISGVLRNADGPLADVRITVTGDLTINGVTRPEGNRSARCPPAPAGAS